MKTVYHPHYHYAKTGFAHFHVDNFNMNIEIILNGKRINIDSSINLPELLRMQGLEPERAVIEYNFKILRKENWEKLRFKPNDNLEILSFVGGG